MPKAKIIFDLDDVDDRFSYNRCNKSLDMACFIFDVFYNLRKKVDSRLDVNSDLDEGELIYDELDKLADEYKIYLAELIH